MFYGSAVTPSGFSGKGVRRRHRKLMLDHRQDDAHQHPVPWPYDQGECSFLADDVAALADQSIRSCYQLVAVGYDQHVVKSGGLTRS